MNLCEKLSELEYEIEEVDDLAQIRKLLEEYEKTAIQLLSSRNANEYSSTINEAINAFKNEIDNLDDPDTLTDWRRELRFVFSVINELCGRDPTEILPYNIYQRLKELSLKYSTVSS